MSNSIAGNVIDCYVKGEFRERMYTSCPNTALVTFMQDHNHTPEVELVHMKRVWSPYCNINVEYTKRSLGVFTRKQLAEAGDTPVAPVVDVFQDNASTPKAVRVVNHTGASPYGRAKELAKQGVLKADGLLTLQREFPGQTEKKLKGISHTIWAQFKNNPKVA